MVRDYWKKGDCFRYGSVAFPGTIGVVLEDAGPGENVKVNLMFSDSVTREGYHELLLNSGRTLMEYIEHTDDDATGFKEHTPDPENVPPDEDPLQQQLARAHAIISQKATDDHR